MPLFKIIALPIKVIFSIIGLLLMILRLLSVTLFKGTHFFMGRIAGGTFGALIGLLLGSRWIRIRFPWYRHRR